MTASHNVIDLRVEETRVSSVTLYPSRAEVTRAVWVSVEEGMNKLNVSGLPTKLDRDSVRIRGQGHPNSTIVRNSVRDDTASKSPPAGPQLRALKRKKAAAQTALTRVEESIADLQRYIKLVDPQNISLEAVTTMLDGYEGNTKRLDEKAADIKEEIAALELEIQTHTPDSSKQAKLRTTISVEILATTSGEVDVYISYFIKDCNWEPSYDIHASINNDTADLELVYKATISQSTAEDWNNTTLTLETLNPSFETQALELEPWKISSTERFRPYKGRHVPVPVPPCRIGISCSQAEGMSSRKSRSIRYDTCVSATGFSYVTPQDEQVPEDEELEEMQTITSLIKISESTAIAHASFQLPGEVTIQGNGEAHSIVTTTVKLSGKLAWVTIPKLDPRAHIKGNFINTSDAHLLKGNANIYLDGVYMKRTELNSIGPGECFDLALGHDPSIRVTYPRRHQVVDRSGYTFGQPMKYTFEQRVLVSNGRKLPVDLKVLDQVPVSGSTNLLVKMIAPCLASPKKPEGQTVGSASSPQAHQDANDPAKAVVAVKKGITASWESEGSVGVKEGVIAWKCHLESQESTELLLKWSAECTDSRYLISGL